MELARITSKGQITIPVDIRKKLGLKDGDKVMFVEENNKIVMINPSMQALIEAQETFKGAAEEAGFESEQDIVDYIAELRMEKLEKKNANNA